MPSPVNPLRTGAAALQRLAARVPREARAWILGVLGVAAAIFLGRWLNARQPLRS